MLIFGIIYGALFAFPYPDLPQETTDTNQFRKSVSMWGLFGGITLIKASLLGGTLKALNKHLISSLSKAFAGTAFVAAGFLYGLFFTLPVPNPPPQGMQWTAHVFVSITLLLIGVGMLAISISTRLLPSRTRLRTSLQTYRRK